MNGKVVVARESALCVVGGGRGSFLYCVAAGGNFASRQRGEVSSGEGKEGDRGRLGRSRRCGDRGRECGQNWGGVGGSRGAPCDYCRGWRRGGVCDEGGGGGSGTGGGHDG